MLEHGGRLHAAAERYGIPLDQWVDLSTGINPNGWSAPPIPADHWRRLPEDDDDLVAAAQHYYRASDVLPLPGSQAAIQMLPELRVRSRVAVIAPGYNEHAHAWQRAGHDVVAIPPDDFLIQAPRFDVAVLIHPNNPTATRYDTAQLREVHRQLRACGGWLIVDEAFMDCTPNNSVASFADEAGLIVLRSLGKFFGLAGARVGFVIAESDLLLRLRERAGPWTIAGPSRWIAAHALRDRDWQQRTRASLDAAQQRLADLLARHGLAPNGGCSLFQWIRTPRADEIHERLAATGILTRLFREPASLRFGLPGNEQQWQRLADTLRSLAA